MSAAVGHDIRKLIAMINERRSEVAHRIIDPGTKAEQCDARGAADHAVSNGGPQRPLAIESSLRASHLTNAAAVIRQPQEKDLKYSGAYRYGTSPTTQKHSPNC